MTSVAVEEVGQPDPQSLMAASVGVLLGDDWGSPVRHSRTCWSEDDHKSREEHEVGRGHAEKRGTTEHAEGTDKSKTEPRIGSGHSN